MIQTLTWLSFGVALSFVLYRFYCTGRYARQVHPQLWRRLAVTSLGVNPQLLAWLGLRRSIANGHFATLADPYITGYLHIEKTSIVVMTLSIVLSLMY